MPRQPRFWCPGAVLHVVQRGNNRAAVFVTDDDRADYLAFLGGAAKAHGVSIHAYVLMPNHVHLLVSPRGPESLARTMQTLGRNYVGRFNHVHRRSGTLWEGRYKSTLVDTDAYLLACMRYIELNPVRARMVAAPADWPWSSHRSNASDAVDPLVGRHPCWLALGSTDAERRSRYRDFVAQGVAEDELRAIRDATYFEWALGTAAFIASVERSTGRRASRLPRGPRPNTSTPR